MASDRTAPGFTEAPAAPEKQNAWHRFVAKALNDPRDVVFVDLALAMTLIQWPLAIALFVMGSFSWWWAPAYWLFAGAIFMDRFILMLHCTCHRPLFNRRFKFLNNWIPWLVGPLFGETPEAYFVHHMGMHHKEGNLHPDLSTTLPYQRDRLTHWLHYLLRFLFVGLPELLIYHQRRGRSKMVRRLVLGEGAFWLTCALLATFVSWQATLVVFVLPVIIVRTLMMAGNWGQHAFVDGAQPGNDFKSSITCINTRYNRRCFNDGYHIIHHLKPSLHYTEMAAEFEANRERYGKEDAIVFDGYDFFEVWFLLMTKQHRKLARAMVQLPGAPERTEEERLEFLRSRLEPILEPTPVAATS